MLPSFSFVVNAVYVDRDSTTITLSLWGGSQELLLTLDIPIVQYCDFIYGSQVTVKGEIPNAALQGVNVQFSRETGWLQAEFTEPKECWRAFLFSELNMELDRGLS